MPLFPYLHFTPSPSFLPWPIHLSTTPIVRFFFGPAFTKTTPPFGLLSKHPFTILIYPKPNSPNQNYYPSFSLLPDHHHLLQPLSTSFNGKTKKKPHSPPSKPQTFTSTNPTKPTLQPKNKKFKKVAKPSPGNVRRSNRLRSGLVGSSNALSSPIEVDEPFPSFHSTPPSSQGEQPSSNVPLVSPTQKSPSPPSSSSHVTGSPSQKSPSSVSPSFSPTHPSPSPSPVYEMASFISTDENDYTPSDVPSSEAFSGNEERSLMPPLPLYTIENNEL